MRQMSDFAEFVRSQATYDKLKTLIYCNCEQDSLSLLKAICLMPIWRPNPPSHVTLDGPWHWTGVATRLAFQMGLHKESTYINKSDAGCRRRIWWQLYVRMHTGEFLPWSWLTLFLQNSDKLQAACWGRPASIRPTDFDVRLPNLDDFEERDVQAQVFVYSTNLYIIVGKIAELCSSTRRTSPESLSELTALLREWLHFLPEDLQLYDSADNRRQYYRPVCEMFIVYLPQSF